MKNAIALLGQPNSGKSTVYNALTGSRQHVGNWPGKTVEKNDGFYTYNGARYTVTDLPGSYGLSGNSDEEIITADFIKADQADLVCRKRRSTTSCWSGVWVSPCCPSPPRKARVTTN